MALKMTDRIHLMLLVPWVMAFSAANASAAAPVSDDIFRDLIHKRLKAHSAGDAKGYRQLLAPDFVHVDDTGKRRTVAEMAAFNGSGNSSRWELGTSHARFVRANLAIVECEVTEFVMFGSRELRMPLQETDVFVHRGKQWLFLEHAETHMLDLPSEQSTSTDSSISDYVGRYQWWSGYEDTITLRDRQLYAQASGDDKAVQLKAASSEAFYVDGDPSIVVFTRDSRGLVTGELVHFADGKVVFARKMPSGH